MKSKISKYNKTFGAYRTPFYVSWSHLKQRCDNINDKDYRHYGGRGIKYIESWKSFYRKLNMLKISFRDIIKNS